MWKSVRFRVRDFRGDVNLDNSDRPVDAKGDVDAVGVAFAHMLDFVICLLVPSVESRVPSTRDGKAAGHT